MAMNHVLLTIDDVSSKNTPAIVDYLQEKGIRALLFAQGDKVEKYYDEAVYALRQGMIMGNHSYSHRAFSSMTAEEGVADIEKCEALLDRLYRDAGVERRFRPFRFPYGDKGGKNKDALQEYLAKRGFDKVDDTRIPYAWWRENGLHTDIDTFWTFDFEEHRLQSDRTFSYDAIREKMQNRNPKAGAALYGEGNRHILLLHAHDETDEILPGYYRLFIDDMLAQCVVFDEPSFL